MKPGGFPDGNKSSKYRWFKGEIGRKTLKNEEIPLNP
jgi:hypothetical protein